MVGSYSKYYCVNDQYILWELAYANFVMYMATIPVYEEEESTGVEDDDEDDDSFVDIDELDPEEAAKRIGL